MVPFAARLPPLAAPCAVVNPFRRPASAPGS